MTTAPATDGWSARVRRIADPIPRDLVGLVAATGIGAAVVRAGATPSTVRALVGFALVLVAPGYALIAALFPARATGAVVQVSDDAGYSPGTGERLVLSVGTSLAVLPVLALVQVALGLPLETGAIALSIAATVGVLAVAATARRLLLAPADRYRAPSLLAATRDVRAWMGRGGRIDTAMTAALTVAMVLAVAGLAYGLAGPQAGTAYTSASLLTASGDGSLVASNYPTNLTAGEREELVLRVENARDRPTRYSVVAQLQRVERGGDGLTVASRERVANASSSVAPGDEWLYRHGVEPTTTGQGLRLAYYVYRGAAPERPTAEGAAVRTHLWVNVAPSSA